MLTRACAAMRTAAGGAGSSRSKDQRAARGSPVQPLPRPVGVQTVRLEELPVGTFDWPHRRAKSPRGACSRAYVFSTPAWVCPRRSSSGDAGADSHSWLPAHGRKGHPSSIPTGPKGPRWPRSRRWRDPPGQLRASALGRGGGLQRARGLVGWRRVRWTFRRGADCASCEGFACWRLRVAGWRLLIPTSHHHASVPATIHLAVRGHAL